MGQHAGSRSEIEAFNASLVQSGIQEGYRVDVLSLLTKDFEIKGRDQIIVTATRFEREEMSHRRSAAAAHPKRLLLYAFRGRFPFGCRLCGFCLVVRGGTPDRPVRRAREVSPMQTQKAAAGQIWIGSDPKRGSGETGEGAPIVAAIA